MDGVSRDMADEANRRLLPASDERTVREGESFGEAVE
jgi:hypothetical protein